MVNLIQYTVIKNDNILSYWYNIYNKIILFYICIIKMYW